MSIGYDKVVITVNFDFTHRNKLYHWINEKQVIVELKYSKYLIMA